MMVRVKAKKRAKVSEAPVVPPVLDPEPTPAIPAQAAVKARPAVAATATSAAQTAQPAQAATPAVAAKGAWHVPWGQSGLVLLTAVVAFVLGWAWKDDTLLQFMTSKFFFIVPMSIGALMFWWILRWMSMSNGTKWAEIMDELYKGNLAVAIYYGCRVLGVAIIVGACISAGTSV